MRYSIKILPKHFWSKSKILNVSPKDIAIYHQENNNIASKLIKQDLLSGISVIIFSQEKSIFSYTENMPHNTLSINPYILKRDYKIPYIIGASQSATKSIINCFNELEQKKILKYMIQKNYGFNIPDP